MLKEFVEKIIELSKNEEHHINGEVYTDKPINYVPHIKHTPEKCRVYSLEALTTLIKTEINKIPELPIFVEVVSERLVRVYSTYDEEFDRKNLYSAETERIENSINYYHDKDEVITQLKSVYKHTDDIEYLLSLFNAISEESKVSDTDNGISQVVEATKGIQMKTNITIKPRVTLAPFRTFLEVEQPESEFLLRLKEGGQVLIKEADGGVWKLEAKKRVKEWLESRLAEEIALNKVKVTA